MKLIYLHGFNSDGNSGTAQKLRGAYPWLISPSYNYVKPKIAFEEIKKVIEETLKADTNIVIIGTSLGGFWANYFGQKYNVKAMLINPTIHPSISLLKYLGENENFNTAKKVMFKKEDADSYKEFEVEPIPGVFRTLVLGTRDNIIDYKLTEKYFKDKAKIFFIDEGHQIENIEKILSPLLQTINYFPE